MKASEALDLYLLSEEFQIEIDQIDPESVADLREVPLEVRIVLNKNGRRRLVNLAFLKIAGECNQEFVRDYLNLDLSLRDIFEKHGVYTELEYVALNCLQMVKDEDAQRALKRLKNFILSRKSKPHGL
ncbi:hypothetical protein GWK48_03680 [Metallosphaera tengchongensis]|uniref:Uncharacterized protein n=1 Tax=Metallosphaera tengchongensis TaxID=1532350 RepID=A0A6N0NSC9_9CREN|nr:hypothetical protein [Metallosphaera tengchongensis]QKQ99611.1 hypothetical protein GWK48_03680 [Metallosphaera tengchongensis]